MIKKAKKLVYNHLLLRANIWFDIRNKKKVMTLESIDNYIALLEGEQSRLSELIEYVISKKPGTAKTILHYGKQAVGVGMMLFGNFGMDGISGHIVTHVGHAIGGVHHAHERITPDNYDKVLKQAKTSYRTLMEKLQYLKQKKQDLCSDISLLHSHSDAARVSGYVKFYGTLYIGSLVLLPLLVTVSFLYLKSIY
jgi:hypothetical protein